MSDIRSPLTSHLLFHSTKKFILTAYNKTYAGALRDQGF